MDDNLPDSYRFSDKLVNHLVIVEFPFLPSEVILYFRTRVIVKRKETVPTVMLQ